MFIAPDHEHAKKNIHDYKQLLRGRFSYTKSPTMTDKRRCTVLAEGLHQMKFERLCQGDYQVLSHDLMDFWKGLAFGIHDSGIY